MTASSYLNEDATLDWDVSIEEIESMIHKLKKGKFPGPDGLMAEHIIYGGASTNLLLKHIFNCILSCETIPHCFKVALGWLNIHDQLGFNDIHIFYKL